MDSVMTHSGTQKAVRVAVLVCIFAGTGLSQTSANSQEHALNSQSSDEALSRMEKSIAQQAAAVEAFRDKAQNPAWREQRESVGKQAGASEHAPDPSDQRRPGGKTAAADEAAFFTLPWPGSPPLSIPNVQMPGQECEALGKGEVDRLVRSAASNHGIAPELLRSVMKQESAFKPCALSVMGAMGLMQIMPETAELLKLKDPFDPDENVDAGAKYLKTMLERFGGNVALALGAYNAGPEAVAKAGGVPPIAETLQYVSHILGDLPIAY
jgi:soluble lytic murein transglycosylase-like protein